MAPVARIWTRCDKLRASKLASDIGLADVIARYWPPDHDKEGKGRRLGLRRLTYEEAVGDAMRSVTFRSLPFSLRLHAITVSW